MHAAVELDNDSMHVVALTQMGRVGLPGWNKGCQEREEYSNIWVSKWNWTVSEASSWRKALDECDGRQIYSNYNQ